MRRSIFAILFCAFIQPALQSCGFIGMTGEPSPNYIRPCPKGCDQFAGYAVSTLALFGFHRDPVLAARVTRTRYAGTPETVLRLTGGEWSGRVALGVDFNWVGSANPAAVSFLAYDRDRKGIRLPDSAVGWTDGGPVFTKSAYGRALVTFPFRGRAWISASAGTGAGKLESYRLAAVRDPAWLANTQMPDEEGEALLGAFAGEWTLVARNSYCGPERGDSIAFRDTSTTWVGTSDLLPRVLTLTGRTGLAGSPGSPQRDSVIRLENGRFISRDPFVEWTGGYQGAWIHPVSFSGSESLFVLTRTYGREQETCGTDWIFARGALLDSLTP
jgi:hypothetical protein